MRGKEDWTYIYLSFAFVRYVDDSGIITCREASSGHSYIGDSQLRWIIYFPSIILLKFGAEPRLSSLLRIFDKSKSLKLLSQKLRYRYRSANGSIKQENSTDMTFIWFYPASYCIILRCRIRAINWTSKAFVPHGYWPRNNEIRSRTYLRSLLFKLHIWNLTCLVYLVSVSLVEDQSALGLHHVLIYSVFGDFIRHCL